MRRRLGLLTATAALALLSLTPALARAATTTIDFSGLPENDAISQQYAGQGVLFGYDPPHVGLAHAEATVPYAHSLAGLGSVAVIGRPTGDVGQTVVSTAFEFNSERRAVSFDLGLSRPDGGNIPVHIDAYAIGGGVLESRDLTLLAGAPLIHVSLGPRSVPEIIGVKIVGYSASGDQDVLMDNISSPIESAPQPKFSVTLVDPLMHVVEGSTATAGVQVRRYNGSVGPVQLSVGSLPSGIQGANFTPNPVSGTNPATLFVTAASPLTGDRQLTVSAAAAPGAPSSVGVPVAASASETVRADTALTFEGDNAPEPIVTTLGCSAEAPFAVHVRGGFRGPVDVTVDPQGIPGTTATKTVQATADGLLRFGIPVPITGAGTGVLHVTLRPHGASAVTRDIPVRTASSIAHVSPTSVKTPQELNPGTRVTLTGEGFCATPSARVRFGNVYADAPILYRNPSGTEVQVDVPRLATSGHVQFVPDEGAPDSHVVDGPSVTVDSYRNTVGFPFHNYKPSLTMGQLAATFGEKATLLTPSIDACGASTFGILHCKVELPTPIPDPWAMLVLGIANQTMGGGHGGACFGFARTAQQLRRGRRPLTGLGNDRARFAFQLPSSMGVGGSPNGAITEAINANQLAQLSNEYFGFYATQAAKNLTFGTAATLEKAVKDHLRAGDDPLLSLRTGGTVDELHVVTAYDIEDDPAGGYWIDVYDSNEPFAAGGYVEHYTDGDVLQDETTDSDVHKRRVEDSRIHVRPDGYWELPSSQMSASSVGNIIVGGLDNPGPRPTLVTAGGALKSGLTMILGIDPDLGGLLSADGRAASAASEPLAQTTQVTSGNRRLFSSPGVLNRDRATALPGTPWAPATGGGTSGGLLLGPDPGARYSISLKGTGSGSETRTVVGPNVGSIATFRTRPGVTDLLSVTPAAGGIGFRSGGGSVPLTLATMARTANGQTHSAQLQLTSQSGGGDTLSFDGRRGALRITHSGGPANARLTLSSFGEKTAPQAAGVSLRLGHGDNLIRLGSWQRLNSGTSRLYIRGQSRRLHLTSVHLPGARVLALSVGHGRRRMANASVRVPTAAAADGVTATFVLLRGKRKLAARSFHISGAGTHHVRWALPRAARRGDRLGTIVTSVLSHGTTFATAQSHRTTRL